MGVLGSVFYATVRYTGFGALARRLRRGAPILCYHNVVANGADATAGEPGLHMPVEQFAEQMRWVAHHYRVVPLSELVDRIERRQSVRRCAVVTFDDGYQGVFDHALPVVRALGLPVTLFIVSAAPGSGAPFWWDEPDVQRVRTDGLRERWLRELKGDAGAIRAAAGVHAPAPPLPRSHYPAPWSAITDVMSDGVEVGAHTATHRYLPALEEADLREETSACADVIEQHTGRRPTHFSYPYGAWCDRVRSSVEAAGYRAAVTLDDRLNRAPMHLLEMRRVNIPTSAGETVFPALLAGLKPR